jgi:WD40 repeat protein
MAFAGAAFGTMLVVAGPALIVHNAANDALALGPQVIADGPIVDREIGSFATSDDIMDLKFLDNGASLLVGTFRKGENSLGVWNSEAKTAVADRLPAKWLPEWKKSFQSNVILSRPFSLAGTKDGIDVIDSRSGSLEAHVGPMAVASDPRPNDSPSVDFRALGKGSLAISADGRRIAARTGSSSRGSIFDVSGTMIARDQFPIRKPAPTPALPGTAEFAGAIAFQPNTAIIAVGFASGISLWDTDRNAEIREIPLTYSNVYELKFSPDGAYLCIYGLVRDKGGNFAQHAAILRADTGTVVKDIVLGRVAELISRDKLDFTEDGSLLVLRYANLATIFDMKTATPIGSFHNGERHGIAAASLSPDGDFLALAVKDIVHVYRLHRQPAGPPS